MGESIQVTTSLPDPNEPAAVGDPQIGEPEATAPEQAEPTGLRMPEAPDGDRPDWLPAKFANPEEFAKSYRELEGKLGGDDAAAAAAPGLTPEAFAVYDTELAASGDLSDASRAAIQAAGIPAAMIDSYIDGKRAVADATASTVYNAVGGQETYNALIDWAQSNLSPAEINALAGALNSSPEAAAMAIRGVQAQAGVTGGSPKLLRGDGSPATPDAGRYESTQQMVADMQKPEYKTDSAFRAKVRAKLARSNFV